MRFCEIHDMKFKAVSLLHEQALQHKQLLTDLMGDVLNLG